MSSARLLLLTKTSHVVNRAARPVLALARPFHSPFAVLGNSPVRSPPSPNVTYEKQLEHSSEPLSGTRTYVVSEPDTSHKFYEVPSGAYPISTPYANFTPTDTHTQVSLTSTSILVHEQTIRTVLDASATIRYRGFGCDWGVRWELCFVDANSMMLPDVSPEGRNAQPDGGGSRRFMLYVPMT